MSLTVGAIVSGVGSSLSGLAQGAITVLKIVASVGFAVLFASAIALLVGSIEQFVATSIIGEIFGIISMCLPFNPATVFGALWFMCSAILTFLIARKTYILVSNLIKTSGA